MFLSQDHEESCEYAAKSSPRPSGADSGLLLMLLEKMQQMELDKKKTERQVLQLIADNEALSKKTAELENDLTFLTRDNCLLRDELQIMKSQSREEMAGHETRLTAMDRSIAVNSYEMTEMRLQLDMLDVRSQNGTFTWKIDNFERRMCDAKTGKHAAIYSPPFYTSPTGYKLCLRLYLNGDGVGRNTHISLFLVVMKGEFDAILPWPFRHRVTLSLLDQDISLNDITESFYTDPRSNSFRRPTSDLNIASGCPDFVAHARLRESHTRGDTLFLRVSVDDASDIADRRIRRPVHTN